MLVLKPWVWHATHYDWFSRYTIFIIRGPYRVPTQLLEIAPIRCSCCVQFANIKIYNRCDYVEYPSIIRFARDEKNSRDDYKCYAWNMVKSVETLVANFRKRLEESMSRVHCVVWA